MACNTFFLYLLHKLMTQDHEAQVKCYHSNSPVCLCSVQRRRRLTCHCFAVISCGFNLSSSLSSISSLLTPPTLPVCRNFDRPKVNIKDELFNSVSCKECHRRRWCCAICSEKEGWSREASHLHVEAKGR